MRPTKTKQSELLHPLNRLLSTEASVRVLRALALARTPLTASEVASRSELGRTSVYPVLRDLERADMIEYVGAGAQRPAQLRERHPLAAHLRGLFVAENARYAELVAELRRVVATSPSRPMSAWIDEEGLEENVGTALGLRFVANPKDIERIADHINDGLAAIEQEFDVSVVVSGSTRSEVEANYKAQTERLANVVLIDGVPPAALLGLADAPPKGAPVSHVERDAAAKKLALALALKIRRDSGVRVQAAESVAKRLQRASVGERRELNEWARILKTMSPARLHKFLTEDSERATRLRQTLPVSQLLTPKERAAVLRSTTDGEVAAIVERK